MCPFHFLTVISWVWNGISLVISTKMSHLSVIQASPNANFWAAQVNRRPGAQSSRMSQSFTSGRGQVISLRQAITCCSVAQSHWTLCDPLDCSTPGFPVLHHFLELAQTHVHQFGDAIQPFHPLSSPSLPAFNLSQHQGLF